MCSQFLLSENDILVIEHVTDVYTIFFCLILLSLTTSINLLSVLLLELLPGSSIFRIFKYPSSGHLTCAVARCPHSLFSPSWLHQIRTSTSSYLPPSALLPVFSSASLFSTHLLHTPPFFILCCSGLLTLNSWNPPSSFFLIAVNWPVHSDPSHNCPGPLDPTSLPFHTSS